MKLQELDAMRPSKQAAKVLESRLGSRIRPELSLDASKSMLRRVRGLIAEARRSPKLHHSEKDPVYLKLIMLEHALSSHIIEAGIAGGVDMSQMQGIADPKVKMTLDKATKGQNLTPEEQKILTGMLMMKKESAKKSHTRVMESEVQQAQVVLAAKDMSDRIQKMLEDVSEMQYKDLPAIVDQARGDLGTEQADAFQSQTTTTLATLLQSLQQAKTGMDAAMGSLTGAEISVPGTEPLPAPTDDMGGEEELDLSLDANVPDEEEAEDQKALGRERR